MKYYKRLEEIRQEQPTVITLGKFDGIHRGHQKLIRVVEKIAKERGLQTLMFTFGISPQTVLGIRDNSVLMTNEERGELASRFGMDMLVECPFTKEIRNMDAEDFVKKILVDGLKVQAVVIGDDFHFGKERAGNAAFLKEKGPKYGFTVDVIEKEMDGQREISSSYVREELAKGNIQKVNELLGYEYFISGDVIRGMHMGTGLGFPTINISPSEEKMLPPRGVYASKTEIDEVEYDSITNIGVKPTIGEAKLGVESFLLNFSGDLYGKKAYVKLLEFERPEKKFDSIEELKKQVEKDIAKRREMV